MLRLIFIVCGFVSISFGQTIVNTEKLFNEDSTKLKFSAELVGSALSGNANVVFLEYSANSAYQLGKNQFMLLTGGQYINEEKKIIANSHFGQLRYSYIQSDLLTPFVFYQIQSNEILLLKRRQLAGIGNKMTLFRIKREDSTDAFVSRISLGTFLEEELLNRTNLPITELYYTNYLRGSANWILSFSMNEKFSLINTTYYQPHLANFSDFRLFNETNLLFEVTDKLSFSIDFEIRYDSDPPSILRNLDVNSTAGILFQL